MRKNKSCTNFIELAIIKEKGTNGGQEEFCVLLWKSMTPEEYLQRPDDERTATRGPFHSLASATAKDK